MKRRAILVLAVVLLSPGLSVLRAQQVAVPRIDLMPNLPSPYSMRDWKSVARGYDSLVFDFNRTGTYLPLVWLNTNTVNYPQHSSFGLHTVVGTTVPASAEAINCLPALVSATLAGIDKSNQNGYNWALMAEEWFNNRPAQDVYKNHPVDDTGDDWWYETMPNVFFYQLNDLYPGTGSYNAQFRSVADRWLQALGAMGASQTPWRIPNMDHRGWYLQTMTPYDDGVHEPEASGAIGWLQYQAWVKTRDPKYRIGAEQAMEFLDTYPVNPAYELQLSYGAYMAARMNAELGTVYDLPRIVNWCFDVSPLRSWGAMTGTWGNYDCSGLIGEVNGTNDYAFAMNTFEQIGALVPMVRYDDRFARAIGKWVLNAANAARLFYRSALPSANQDSYAWSAEYDTSSVIAHEAMRQFNGGTSPYATGDAISGGWGQTNLALYGSSHAGILAGIIDTTNIPMILRLNLLATDYYHDTAYPSYLYFNPYDSAKIVQIDVGPGARDLYDAASNQFVAKGVSGVATFSLSANSAASIVVAPPGGSVTYRLDEMLVNGVVVNYHSGQAVADYPPRIKALAADRATALPGDTVRVYCTAMDRNGDTLTYTWSARSGTVAGSGSAVGWIADSLGAVTIICIVGDGRGGFDTARVTISVAPFIDHPPVIAAISAQPRKLNLNDSSAVTVTAADPDSTDTLHYAWASTGGTFTGGGASVKWIAPDSAGNYLLLSTVTDGRGGVATDSITLEVRDFSQNQTGSLVAWYPFTGNAADSSGNGHDGTVHGAVLTADRSGNPSRAYAFNGATADIQVPNSAGLNFVNSISVNFWINVGAFFQREQYPLSHGNWTSRWKVSITNNGIRWTIKTTAGVKDLDSETKLALNSWHNVAVSYNGTDMELWLDGNLDAFTSWSGTLLTSPVDLTMGQVLPTDQGYNFQGALDEVRIYDYALSVREIDSLAGAVSGIASIDVPGLPREYSLSQNHPNPFNPATVIEFAVPRSTGVVKVGVYDILGKEVASLVNENLRPGMYRVSWDGGGRPSGIYFYRMRAGQFSETKKMLLIR